MKKILLSICLLVFTTASFSQWQYDSTPADEDEQAEVPYRISRQDPGLVLQKSRWFYGGGLIAGLGSDGGALGISPLAGYKLNDYVDVGMGLNFIYNYNRYRYWDGVYTGERDRAFNIGLMPFARVFPINEIFVQLQFEQAWVHGTYRANQAKQNYNYDYQALITSLGYANRINGRVSFFMSVGIDVLSHKNSPYRYGNGKLIPVIATGINF